MKTFLSLILATILLAGCNTVPTIETVYVDKKVPVNAVPAPPIVPVPLYETKTLTPEDRKDVGIVAKALVVENKQKDGYITILECVIAKYNELAKKSAAEVLLDFKFECDQPE